MQTVVVSVPGPRGPSGEGNVSDEQIAQALEDYFTDNPITAASTEWGDAPYPTLIFENGLL